MKINFLILTVLFAFLIGMPSGAFAQEEMTKKEQKQLEKKKKKEEKEAAELEARKAILLLLEEKQFVFMANTLSGDGGKTFSVSPKFNFLSLDGDQAVFQFAFDGLVGWNGIGGITLTGEIDDYKVDPGKNANKPIRAEGKLIANTHWGRPYFSLSVFNDGYANITMSVKAGTVNMAGQLVSIEESGVYQGREILIDR